MKVSIVSILTCIATVVEGGVRRGVTPVPTFAAADDNNNIIIDALDAVPDGNIRQLANRKKKRRRRKKENKNNDDDDDANKTTSSAGKRLMMYCEKKFMWQGKAKCPDWCLEASSCKSGASLRLRKCGGSSKQKWENDNGVLRPSCSGSLSVGSGRLVRGSTKVGGLGSGKSRFEIRKGSKCFTNHHHPRDKEVVSLRDCGKARKSNTALWTWD